MRGDSPQPGCLSFNVFASLFFKFPFLFPLSLTEALSLEKSARAFFSFQLWRSVSLLISFNVCPSGDNMPKPQFFLDFLYSLFSLSFRLIFSSSSWNNDSVLVVKLFASAFLQTFPVPPLPFLLSPVFPIFSHFFLDSRL